MQKILILITNDNFVRNYINTSALEDLEKNFECFYIVNKELKTKFKKKKSFTYIHGDNEKEKFKKFILKLTFLNHSISKSVKFSIQRYTKIKIWWPEENLFKKIINTPKRIIAQLVKWFLFFILSNPLGKFFFKNIKINMKENKDLIKAVNISKPDLVLIPTQGQDIGDYDMIRICAKKKIKTLSLIDNWDNLSSRVMPQPFSNYFGVWGKQSKKHAIKIQKIKKNTISIIGTPRFDHYKNFKKKSLFNFKYILFIEGFGLTENMNEIFDKLEVIFSHKLFREYKLIYRPHPWRKDTNIINIKNYRNIIIDPQLKKNYLDRKFDSSIQPDLSYYPKLISNAKFIISAPTTMVIESMIFKKNIIVLGHKSNTVFDHYNHVVKLNHCDGIEKVKNVKMCWDLDKLFELSKKFLLQKKSIDKKDIKLDYFIHQDKKPYSKNLLKLVNSVIKN
jgi:hypothetical protein